MTGSPRMLVAFTLAAAIVVGAIIGVATGFWWALALAILIHFARCALTLMGGQDMAVGKPVDVPDL